MGYVGLQLQVAGYAASSHYTVPLKQIRMQVPEEWVDALDDNLPGVILAPIAGGDTDKDSFTRFIHTKLSEGERKLFLHLVQPSDSSNDIVDLDGIIDKVVEHDSQQQVQAIHNRYHKWIAKLKQECYEESLKTCTEFITSRKGLVERCVNSKSTSKSIETMAKRAAKEMYKGKVVQHSINYYQQKRDAQIAKCKQKLANTVYEYDHQTLLQHYKRCTQEILCTHVLPQGAIHAQPNTRIKYNIVVVFIYRHHCS